MRVAFDKIAEAACLALGLSMAFTSACSNDDSSEAVTQLLVSVDGDDDVVVPLKRLEVEIYRSDVKGDSVPERTRVFPLTRNRPTEGAVRMPFSFGITKRTADEVRLVLTGYLERDGGAPVIERKMLAQFAPQASKKVAAYLSSACFRQKHPCVEIDYTCAPTDSDRARAGECSEVHLADPMEDVPSRTDADMSRLDAVAASGACEGVTECSADYPCEPSSRAGFACRGQHAQWRMPDQSPGAKFAPDYDVETDPSVAADRVTGLIWQRELPAVYPDCTGTSDVRGDVCTWQEAIDYCLELDLNGERWRLPSKIELESIIGDSIRIPALDLNVFPDENYVPGYWSASTVMEYDNHAWGVQFGYALSGPFEKIEARRARCVRSELTRSGTPEERLVVDRDADTVTDTHTDLVWRRTLAYDVLSQQDAVEYCEGLGDGWRLPGFKELLTLVDPTSVLPASLRVFPEVPITGMLWSSAPARYPMGADGLLVDMGVGYVQSDKMVQDIIESEPAYEITFNVRCVQ